jgi:hypothetical protein
MTKTNDPDSPRAARRPQGLSGQEEEELRALEKGYDDVGGALPDPDFDSDARREAAEAGGPGARPAKKPLKEAERRGLLPRAGTVAPPLDDPDDDDAGPADPATGKGR